MRPRRSLTARQLKGVIAQCDAVVCRKDIIRLVAALSQAIPVLAIGWHAKYEGVMRLVGQESLVCQVGLMTLDELKAKFDELWHSREAIHDRIAAALPRIQQRIWECAREVAHLMQRKRPVDRQEKPDSELVQR